MPELDQTVAKETPALFWLGDFDGLNARDSRDSIEDQECSWIENFMPIGKGNARTMYDAATPIFTAAQAISYDYPFNISGVFYKLIILADGSAKQIRLSDGAATTVAAAATFALTPTLPAATQYGTSGILIVATNGYWAWDGTLYAAGAFAPAWLSGQALLTPTGNTHTNTTVDSLSSATGIVNGMTITDVTHADIPANTTVTAGAGTTTLTISQAATGTHTGDTLNIGWTMPSGIVGQCIAVYQGHVWIGSGASRFFSAPGNGAVFSTAQGGGTTVNTDGQLVSQYMNVMQSNGFLYWFGDGEITVVSNVQTSGSPATTTFNEQNIDPQTGLGWRDALVPFGRALCFANASGVYALFGGAAEKISDKLDTLFQNANFSTVVPTMFATTIFSVRCIGIILNTLDPTTNTQRTVMCLWNGKKWFVGSQTLNTIFGSTVEQMGSPNGWGNDGTRMYQLFQTASLTLQKKIQSKLWAGRSNLIFKNAMRLYVETVNKSATNAVVLTGTLDSDRNASVAFNLTSLVTWLNNSLQVVTWLNNSSQLVNWISQPSGVAGQDADQSGLRLGLTLTSTSPDWQLVGTGESYNESTIFG